MVVAPPYALAHAPACRLAPLKERPLCKNNILLSGARYPRHQCGDVNGDRSFIRASIQIRCRWVKGYVTSNKNEGWSKLAPPAFSDLTYRLLDLTLTLNRKPLAYSGIPAPFWKGCTLVHAVSTAVRIPFHSFRLVCAAMRCRNHPEHALSTSPPDPRCCSPTPDHRPTVRLTA